ncbi:TIGR03084 family metal-binding protein [Paenarthrobacter sp. NPDC090520]|uniref:TIGR03084 family metal-binding protein n=1 Tax=Paenarthrobacter sp. NPDC090520 TaxID=3364382 RepID=UPI0037F4ACEF
MRREGEALDQLVAALPPSAWALATPAEGWTIAHQIAHLTATDENLLQALMDPQGFSLRASKMAEDPSYVDKEAARAATEGSTQMLARWRAGRAAILESTEGRNPRDRVPWFGPDMSLLTALTARLMETWAHAQDVADTLAAPYPVTERLKHVITLAILARDYAFRTHGFQPPQQLFRISLESPDGGLWTWGPDDAQESVTGVALDFALLAVRRRHRRNSRVFPTGPLADRWLDVVQAYAGSPGTGREPA